MFNLIKDEFDENTDDILKSINKLLEKSNNEIDKDNQNNRKEED